MFFVSYLIEHNRYMNVLGILVILGIAWLFSQKRSSVNYRLIGMGLLMQFIVGLLALKTNIGHVILEKITYFVGKLYLFSDAGSGFIFGNLINVDTPWGFVFAFRVLPVIIFFGAFMSLLFYFNIIQYIVQGMSILIRPLLGTSGAETLCAVSNSFLGQTEAPLLVRHYLKHMTKSEMLVVMVSGMATISGAILVVYGQMGVPVQHLLVSCVMSIPASILIAKILLPETETPKTIGGADVEMEAKATNVFDAVATGTTDGLHLALNVGAMLISFLALLALLNYVLSFGSYKLNMIFSFFSSNYRLPELSLELIFSYLFSPFGYLLGFTGQDVFKAADLIGTKIAVNELIAYGKLVKMNLSERAEDIITYALCGFSNFSCIGIQIGGIGALVPEKRQWLTELGLYAVLGGSLANILSAMIAALLI